MKANNLVGDYCQTCASILDEAQRNFRTVVILDGQCAQVFQQTGDAERFNVPLTPKPKEIVTPPFGNDPVPETPKKPEPKPTKKASKKR